MKDPLLSKKPTILFTIEHKSREFIPKCLLSHELIKKGFRVYIGTFPAIDKIANIIEPSIYFHKSTFIAKSEYYKNLGHKFIFLDEEGGITIPKSSVKDFCRLRYKYVSDTRNDLIFLPGKNFEKNILKLPNIRNLKNVEFHTTGWPRIDLWRKEYYYLYKPKAEIIKKKHGNYYLLITSFGMTNKKTYENRIKTSTTEFQKKIRKHKYHALLNYIELIKGLSTLMQTGEKLIVRPHPSESTTDWKRIAKKLTNVHVVNNGDITPWILASDGIIQYGSTTAIQASLNGIICIQYKIDRKHGITDTPSFELCVDAATPQDVYKLLKENKGRKNKNIQEKAKKVLKEEMAYDTSQLATTKISNILKNVACKPIKKPKISPHEKIHLYLLHTRSYAKHVYYKINKFALKKNTLIEKVPGGIEKDEVKEILELLNKNTPKPRKIRYEQVCKNLVCIESE